MPSRRFYHVAAYSSPVLQETIPYPNTQITLKEKNEIVNYLNNKIPM